MGTSRVAVGASARKLSRALAALPSGARLADESPLTFTMTCRRVVARGGPGARGKRAAAPAQTAADAKDAAARFRRGGRRARGGGARRRSALRGGARAAVSALEQYFDGAELPHAANAKESRKESGRGPQGTALPATCGSSRRPRTRRRASRPRGRRRAARGMRRGRDPGFSGVGFSVREDARAATGGEGAPGPGCEKQNASSLKEKKQTPVPARRPDKRRRVGVGGGCGSRCVAMDAGEERG